ncbi:MAG: RNA polymerase primary sigma factor [Pirellulaceae bacterium]
MAPLTCVLPESTTLPSNQLSSLQARARRLVCEKIDYRECSPLDECPKQYCPELCEFDFSELTSAARLTAAQESFWFGRLNALKQKADHLRIRLDTDSPSLALIELVELQLGEADRIRNALLAVFAKLAVALATRIAGTKYDFDEFISEANWTLFLAMNKFDTSRGFRFSTYATHAIRRNLFRYIQNKQTQCNRAVGVDSPESFPDTTSHRHDERQCDSSYSMLNHLVSQLEERERSIVVARFGLQKDQEPRTLRGIAGEFGISRERVRQLEQRALKRLKSLAADEGFEPFELLQIDAS